MTPHINAKKEQIANIVIMPGDPLRAKWIAENYLTNYELVNSIRGMLAYTGFYKEKRVTIMGHGMGIPSIGIYSYELFKFYDVDIIIRVGSAGSYVKEIDVGDVFLVDEVYSESNYANLLGLKEAKNVLPVPSKEINELILSTSKELNINLFIGRCYSSDVFYTNLSFNECYQKTKAKVVEMEAYGLFANALMLNKKATTLLTCSDSFVSHKCLSPIERQESFSNMIKLILESIIKL